MSHPGIGHDEYGIAATGGCFIKLASGFAGAGASSCSRLWGAYECRGANDVVSPMSSSCWNMQSHRFNHLLSSTLNIFEYSNIKYLWMTTEVVQRTSGVARGCSSWEAGIRAEGWSWTEQTGHFYRWALQYLIQIVVKTGMGGHGWCWDMMSGEWG